MAVTSRPGDRSSRSGNTADYRRSFRTHVFQLLKMGYERLNAGQHQSSEETDITGELVRTMGDAIEDRTSPRWVQNYAVHDDPPVNTPGRFGKRRKRIDVQFERIRRGRRPRFGLEAKRLYEHSGVPEYLGDEGLGEFLQGNYARREDEAGMIGYVQTDTPADWSERIKAKVNRRNTALHVTQDGKWRAEKIVPGMDNTYCTSHARPGVGNRRIDIYHVLLDFISRG